MITESDKRQLLEKLVEGNISPSEYHQLEIAALDDPFLFDALEGYHTNSSSDFKNNLENLNDNIDNYIVKKSRKRQRYYYLAAASFIGILITTIVLYDLFKTQTTVSNTDDLAKQHDIADQEADHASTHYMNEDDAIADNDKSKNIKSISVQNKISNKKKKDSSTLEAEVQKYDLSKEFTDSSKLVLSNKSDNEVGDLSSFSPSSAQKPKINFPEKNKTDLPIGTRIISGRVTDKNGLLLVGAKLSTEYSETITDIEGNFQLGVTTQDKVLKAEFVGYEPGEIALAPNSNTFNIELKEGVLLDEVVVTGSVNKHVRMSTSSSATIHSKKQSKAFDKAEDWKNFDLKVHSAIKKMLIKSKYDQKYDAKIKLMINSDNKIYEVNIMETSDRNLDENVIKVVEKTKKKVPRTKMSEYILDVLIVL